jgi:hypothetical protein
MPRQHALAGGESAGLFGPWRTHRGSWTWGRASALHIQEPFLATSYNRYITTRHRLDHRHAQRARRTLTVRGRGLELMDVLADEPRVVTCDLAGMTAEGSAMRAKGFSPVGEYLTQWPGTVVMVYAPDPQLRSRFVRRHVGRALADPHLSRWRRNRAP